MLDFSANRLVFGDLSYIPLLVRPGGHLTFDFIPSNAADLVNQKILKTVFAASSESEGTSADSVSKIVNEQLFWKLHFHLGHSDVAGIKRLCDLSGYSMGEIKAREWLQTCKCGRDDRQPQLPIIGKHLGPEPGETVMIDLIYPHSEDAQKNPAMIMVCPMTRYVACRFVSDLRPATLLAIFVTVWIAMFSYPKLIISDQGTPFQGTTWKQLREYYSITMSSIPRESPNQIGACEKQ